MMDSLTASTDSATPPKTEVKSLILSPTVLSIHRKSVTTSTIMTSMDPMAQATLEYERFYQRESQTLMTTLISTMPSGPLIEELETRAASMTTSSISVMTSSLLKETSGAIWPSHQSGKSASTAPQDTQTTDTTLSITMKMIPIIQATIPMVQTTITPHLSMI